MILLNGLLALGFAAIAIPIVVHILHKKQIQRQEWAAMRFIIDMFAVSRRRIILDQLILLLIRAGLVALVVLALTRPALQPNVEVDQIVRPGERMSAVVLIDNSFSSMFGREQQRLEAMKELAYTYIETLREGDEISIISVADGAVNSQAIISDPLYDLDAARQQIERLEASTQVSNIPEMLQAGIDQVQRHLNPAAEVMLITDGFEQGWQSQDRGRWDDIQDAFTMGDEDTLGTKKRPRLVIAHPTLPDEASFHNISVTDIQTSQSVVNHRHPTDIVVTLRQTGAGLSDLDTDATQIVVVLSIDQQVVDQQELEIAEWRQREVLFQHQFDRVGSHTVTVEIQGTRDHLSADDSRSYAVQVSDHVPVLFIEGQLEQRALAATIDSRLGAGGIECAALGFQQAMRCPQETTMMSLMLPRPFATAASHLQH